jgi:hypothetical protein
LSYYSDKLANKLGFEAVPWFSVTKYVLYAYSMMTFLICFERADFLNITIIAAAFHMLMHPKHVRRWTFRTLLYATILTFLYDLFWLILFTVVTQIIINLIRNGVTKNR